MILFITIDTSIMAMSLVAEFSSEEEEVEMMPDHESAQITFTKILSKLHREHSLGHMVATNNSQELNVISLTMYDLMYLYKNNKKCNIYAAKNQVSLQY